MNRGRIISLAIGLLFLGSIFAQEGRTVIEKEDIGDKYKVITNRFFDNWFVGAGAGGQIYFGENDSKLPYSKRLKPIVNVYLGKWFTPGIGTRIGIEGSQASGLTKNNGSWYESYYNTGEVYDGLFKQKIKYLHLNAEAMFNVSDLLGGHNYNRFYSIIPHAGLGLIRSANSNDSHEHELSVVAGILNTFRLSNALNLSLDLKGALFNGHFSHKQDLHPNNPGRGDFIASATLGLVYKFGKRNWDRGYDRITNYYNEDELNDLRRQLNEANSRKPEQIVRIDTVRTESQFCDLFNSIFFDFDKATITPDSEKTLDDIAAYMKNNDSKRYLITGYTDSRGSDEYNINLSKHRAQAVVDALTQRGVSAGVMKFRGVGKKIAFVKPSGSDDARRTDRKVAVEFITNDAYWDLLP